MLRHGDVFDSSGGEMVVYAVTRHPIARHREARCAYIKRPDSVQVSVAESGMAAVVVVRRDLMAAALAVLAMGWAADRMGDDARKGRTRAIHRRYAQRLYRRALRLKKLGVREAVVA